MEIYGFPISIPRFILQILSPFGFCDQGAFVVHFICYTCSTILLLVFTGLVGLSCWTRHRFWFRYLRHIKANMRGTGKGTPTPPAPPGENNHNSDLYRKGAVITAYANKQEDGRWVGPMDGSPNSIDMEVSSSNIPIATEVTLKQQFRSRKGTIMITTDIDDVINEIRNEAAAAEEDPFLTKFDMEVLDSMGTFNNRPVELLRICSASPVVSSPVPCHPVFISTIHNIVLAHICCTP